MAMHNNITFDFQFAGYNIAQFGHLRISYNTNYNDHSVLASAPANSLNVGVSDDTGKPPLPCDGRVRRHHG